MTPAEDRAPDRRTDRRTDRATLLMLSAVTATCTDCGDERIFVPVDGLDGELCCTSCDAAVFLLAAPGTRHRRPRSRVA